MLQPILWITIKQLFIKPPPPLLPSHISNKPEILKIFVIYLVFVVFFLAPQLSLTFLLIFLFYVCLPNFCPHLQSVYSLYLAFSSFLLLTTFTFCSLFLSLHITLYPGVSAELCIKITYHPLASRGVRRTVCPLSLTIQRCPPNCVSLYHLPSRGVRRTVCPLSLTIQGCPPNCVSSPPTILKLPAYTSPHSAIRKRQKLEDFFSFYTKFYSTLCPLSVQSDVRMKQFNFLFLYRKLFLNVGLYSLQFTGCFLFLTHLALNDC